jgi:hypothetical protein
MLWLYQRQENEAVSTWEHLETFTRVRGAVNLELAS